MVSQLCVYIHMCEIARSWHHARKLGEYFKFSWVFTNLAAKGNFFEGHRVNLNVAYKEKHDLFGRIQI